MAGLVTATILNNHNELDPRYEVLSIDVAKVINRIPYAQIVLLDGDVSKQTFPLSNSTFFEPGQIIEIRLHYEGESQKEKDTTVFKGLITQHGIQVSTQQSSLTIELKDVAFTLSTQRKNAVFSAGNEKLKDSAVIEEILRNAKKNGISLGNVVSTKAEHTEMVQFYCSDWDFILSRAEANGYWVRVEDGKINIEPPDLSLLPKHKFIYGIDTIFAFEMDTDIQHQYGVVQGTAWDEVTQQLYPSPKNAQDFSLFQGNLSPKLLANHIGSDCCDLVTSCALDESEIQAWADAQMIKSRLSLMRGLLQVPGFADIHLGDVMELDGVGSRFNGKTIVTGIRHQVNTEGWVTDIQFGLSANWFAQNRDIVDVPASGLLPGVNGLQIGVVDKYLEDPDKKLRVRVKVPMLSNQIEGLIWARLAALDAGPQQGTFFRPEPGDEVILGFLNDDPRQAIILGSVHSDKNKPPWEINEKNDCKGIVTKKKLTLSFNDEDKKESIIIETPGGNKIILTDEQDKGIEIIDMNNNSITMSSKGIDIKSSKDITLEGKNIILKGDKVDVK